MSRRLYVLRNDSSRPTDEVDEIVRFVVDRPQIQPLPLVAIRVRDDRPGVVAAAGIAYFDGSQPKWAGRAKWATSVTIPTDERAYGGRLSVCLHATEAKRMWGKGYEANAEWLAGLVARGETKVGRWPIRRIDDWRDSLVYIVAHEVRHLDQYESGRSLSEVDCENFAAALLDEWRNR